MSRASAEVNTLATMLAISRFLPANAANMFGRLSLSPKLIRAGAWALAALVVGWVLANWFWQLAAPDATPRLETAALLDHQAAAKVVASRHLFGQPSSAGDESGGERSEIQLKLLGAMTASPEAAGFAILAEEGKPSVAAVEGETFMPGATLLQVLPGQVRVKIGERVETIEMMKSANTAGTALEESPASTVQAVPGGRKASARSASRMRPEIARP
jgi:hypothetical protein